MPPRPARRTTRFTSREPEQGPAHDSPNALVRPQLPPLQGTPSSRRQYTYGSAVEPPPRVGAGLQRMDLQNAVNLALSKPDEEEEFVRPTRPRSIATRTEEDSTARDNASRIALGAALQLASARDDDSSRSFGLENDYYEDATIGSAPALTSGAEKRQAVSKPSSRMQRDSADELDSQPLPRDLPTTSTQVGKSRDSQPTATSTRHTRQKSRDLNTTEPKTTTAPAAGKSVNTPAMSRIRQNASKLQPRRPQLVEDSQEEESSEDSGSESEQQPMANANRVQPRPYAGYRPASQEPFQDKRRPRDDKGGFFSRGDKPESRSSAFERVLQIPDDPRERDRLIQQEIQEAEDQLARERAEREDPEHVQFQARTWQHWFIQRFAWLLSSWPFNLIWRRREVDEFDEFDDDEANQGGPTEWRRLLNPITYLDSLIWFLEKIIDRAINLIDRISGIQVRNSWLENLLWTVTVGTVGLLLGALIISGAAALRPSIPDFPDMGSMPTGGMHWPNPIGFASKIGNIVPSVSWPSWPSWGGDDDDAPNPWDAFPIDNIAIPDNYKHALDELKKHANGQKKTLDTLKSVLPTIVQMDLVDGRPVIKQEFWHALQDLLKKDGSFLNLDHKNGNYEVSSEKQWKAIVSRLERDSNFNKKLNTDVDRSIKDKLPNFWDTWFRNNNDVLEPLFDKAMAKRETAGSGAKFDQKLYKIVNEELNKYNQTAVSREEFVAHLKRDFATHEADIKEQLANLESRMKSHIEESVRSARMLAPKGTSDNDMRELIREIVRQTLADGTLAAAAKNNIHAHYNSDLKHQVNFFAVGAGATIETQFTTPTWAPYGKGNPPPDNAFRTGLAGALPLPPLAALHPWQDEGECWCTSHDLDGQGRPHGARLSIQLGHLVVPENVVIEHIHPDATTDPDARPRHIEVFARFDDERELEIVRDFSASQVTNMNGWNFSPAPIHSNFVKISQFEYQGDQLNEGVHVQRISGDFVNLGIPTDHIIIRALSNYGAKDHTCFYRVRLFGKEKTDELV
ncbi:uncharacterized protein QYS62_003868 [Fusarium acuminatum]|uniref:SUN domain-containing protein n=1 Tax=Fusarium acuminatum TaxID=5515 RepID=A0ABZ2WSH5_9HYPO